MSEPKEAKQNLLHAIAIFEENFPDNWDDDKKETEMLNIMDYHNNFEELMVINDMTIEEYAEYAIEAIHNHK